MTSTARTQLNDATRSRATLAALADAIDLAHAAEAAAERAWAALHIAEARAREELRTDIDVKLRPGFASDYAEWKRQNATATGRTIARQELAGGTPPPPPELHSVRVPEDSEPVGWPAQAGVYDHERQP